MKMAKERTQLNINIDTELLMELKTKAIKDRKTLTEYVTEKLTSTPGIEKAKSVEERILRIKENLGIKKSSTVQINNI